jgi:hypothetical protein
MKKLLLLITGLLVCITLSAQQDEVLTNSSVIDMFSKKLPSSIIMGKIKSAKNTFNVDTDALLLLTENKVPEEIINAMIEAANDNSRKLIVFNPNNPKDMHDPGIYYFKKTGEKVEMIRIDPTIYSQNKSKGALAMTLTYGLAKVKTTVTLDGKSSRLQFSEQRPEFYIYFDISNNKPSETGEWWFSTATSPNEFLLVKLEQNKKTREVVTGSANIMGASVGVDDKNKAVFKTEKISKGIFRIYFDEPLQGEYCFMYAGNVPTGFSSLDKVYDFGTSK